ncbi:hypothetical protein Q31a_56410 [Aureliella helgolandensis]|uniref:Uncharacterized protein n=1 Tax=Aureliella helgolandensis TaxID=2527968 RepID=A0A518GF97_9BACT|nr:hypothetical protein Q31a_56410 [Aureliella helgolandensis]
MQLREPVFKSTCSAKLETAIRLMPFQLDSEVPLVRKLGCFTTGIGSQRTPNTVRAHATTRA